ncbi:MAG: fumarylacetoacetate hydrolase family protein, partial [Saprospiraceae bacterium]|nr:fumarylacetoacetate hydrolase family protein [Saprospiraceae bacterium]
AEDYIFGMTLFNDWSARDIQSWEYAPLGPFLGKNFASTMSPWVVTLEALEPFKTKGPAPEKKLLPYLQYNGAANYNIDLEVTITPSNRNETTIVQSNSKYLYWNIRQQLAHHTINGCNINIGDVMASGTISGPDHHSLGSMLELTEGGKKTLPLSNEIKRTFLEDLDTITLKGRAIKGEVQVGFGTASAQILPALS